MSAWIGRGVLAIGLLSAVSASAKNGQEVRVEPIPAPQLQNLRQAVSFAAAAACTVGNDSAITYIINGWVVGEEIYKAYIDPAKGCPSPYPFTIQEVNMPMQFAAACTLLVSVDIEQADLTVPTCPSPGILIDTSATYQITIPAAGGYNIWIPLDDPVVVNEPIFAGVYLQSAIAAAKGAAVFCDNDARTCFSYNIWDTQIGYIDLVSNQYFNFPGRLAMYINGLPGGPVSCCQGITGNLDASIDGMTDGSDLQAIVDYIFFTTAIPSTCFEENDVNADLTVDPSDLQQLIDFIFFNFPPVNCP